ncbi:hypothetical protein [uncultured Bosea sp.]|uniref:hypothetical protein n=1 Tax=uncultured Bosea sp. TaxID=211457 RepID=UPI0025F32F19|nr:hypothetical protein [uncultured Bosea sp.]
MYIETIPRRLGGLGRHLTDTGRGSNECVLVRSDLSRDVPEDVTLALRVLAAPARRIRRMKRDIVHIVVSPERRLSSDEIEQVLRTIEAEYGIPEGSARLVVEHQKGDRAHHFHVAFSMASEVDGKALRFWRSGDRDEMLARRLEIELGEALQPSTRVDRTVELLRERGRDDLAELAAQGPVAEKGLRQSKAEVRQDKRLGVDSELINARVLYAWRQAGGDLALLREELEGAGFRLAAGDKRIAGVPIVQLIDSETLKSTSLTRYLNRLRVNGDGPRIREVAVGASMGELPAMDDVKARLRNDAPQRSAEAVLTEYDRLVAEMEADGEREEAIKAGKGRARLAARLSAEERDDLRARQMKVRGRYRQRDRIRRARVNRGFIAAKLFAGREIRKAVFYMVAVGVLATGAGLIPALAAAGIAVATIPSYASAKRLRIAADQAAIVERSEMAQAVREESQRFFRERAVARRIAEQQDLARKARMRAEQANLQRRAQADLLLQQQNFQRLRQQAQQEDQARRRAALNRLPHSPGGQGPIGTGQHPRARPTARQRPRGRDIER